MQNMSAISAFLRQHSQGKMAMISYMDTLDGHNYYDDGKGGAWRLYRFVPDSICLQRAETAEDFYESARGFGGFQYALRDFPAEQLKETIEKFHDTRDRYRKFREAMEERGYEYLPMMAAIAHGTGELVNRCGELLSRLPPIRTYEAEAVPAVPEVAAGDRSVRIENHDGVYFVEGEWLLRLLQTTNLEDTDSLQYFQRVLQSSGVIDALVKAGIHEGDTVSIYDLEFDFVY